MPTRWYEYEPEDTYLKRKEKERQKGILEKIQPPAVSVPSRPATTQPTRTETPRQSAAFTPWTPQQQTPQLPSWLEPFTPTPQQPLSLPPAPTTITPWLGRQEPMSVAPSPQFSASLSQRQTPTPALPGSEYTKPTSFVDRVAALMRNPFPTTQQAGESDLARTRRLGLRPDGTLGPSVDPLAVAGAAVAGLVGTAQRLNSANPSGPGAERAAARLERFGAPTQEDYLKLNPMEQWEANKALGRQMWGAEVMPVLEASYKYGAGWKVGAIAAYAMGEIDEAKAAELLFKGERIAAGRALAALHIADALGLTPAPDSANPSRLTSFYGALTDLQALEKEPSLREGFNQWKEAVDEGYALEAKMPMVPRLIAGILLDPLTYAPLLQGLGVVGKGLQVVDKVQNYGWMANVVMSEDPVSATAMYLLQMGAMRGVNAIYKKTIQGIRPGQALSVDQQVQYLAEAARREAGLQLVEEGRAFAGTSEEAAQFARTFDENMRLGAAEIYRKVSGGQPLTPFEQRVLESAQYKLKLDTDPALVKQVRHLQASLRGARASLEQGWANVSDATRQRWEAMGMTREAGEVPVGGPFAGEPEEPWRMAADDYVSRYRSEYVEGRLQTDSGLRRIHEKLVADALARGDDVPMTARPEWAIPFEEFARREWGGDAYGQQKAIENDAALREQYALVIDSAVKRGDPVPADILAARRSPASTLPLGDALRPVFGGAQQARPQMDAPNAAPEPLRLEMQYADDAARAQAERQAAEAAGQTSMFGETQPAQAASIAASEIEDVERVIASESANTTPGVFWVENGELVGVHVTDNPQGVIDAVRSGAPVDQGKAGDLGPGLYISDAAELWMSRSRDKWGFLSQLSRDQLERLAGAIRAHPWTQRPHITESERAMLERDLDLVEKGTYNPEALVSFANQPYNIPFWRPEFLEPLGIIPSQQPQKVRVHLRGRFAELSRRPTPQILEQLRRAGLDGAFLRSGMGSDPQLVVWNRDAVTQVGEHRVEAVEPAQARLRDAAPPEATRPASEPATLAPAGPRLAESAPEAPAASPELRLALDMRIGQSEREARENLARDMQGQDWSINDFDELTRTAGGKTETLYVRHDDAQEQAAARELGFARGTLVDRGDVPDTMYHTTARAGSVFQTGNLLPGTTEGALMGLSGPVTGRISLASTLEEAESIRTELLRYRDLMNSAYGETQDLLRRFADEDIATEQVRAGGAIPGIREAEQAAQEAYRRYANEDLDAIFQPTALRDALRLSAVRAYETYLFGRERAGGRPDPAVMAGQDNFGRFVGLAPDDIAILKIPTSDIQGNFYKISTDPVRGEYQTDAPRISLANATVVVRGQEQPLPAGGLTQGAQGAAAREESLRAKMLEDLRRRRDVIEQRATERVAREEGWNPDLPRYVALDDMRGQRQLESVDLLRATNMISDAEASAQRERIYSEYPRLRNAGPYLVRYSELAAERRTAAAREPVARVEEVPAEVTEPTVVARIRTGKVTLDPQRFQFKLDVNAEGVTRSLDNVQVWDPALGAGVSLWKDPANGKIYVVNGHHRVALARRLGVEYIEAPYMIAADTAEQARFIGAMQNIAGGRGTAIDAAKLFRENSLADAELEARGISLSESLVRDGLALSRLHPTLFGAVVRKELPIRRAVIIGSKIESQDMQLQFLKEIEKLSAGRRTDAVISELADAFVGGPRGTVEQAGLWGTITQERSYVPERAEVAAYVKAELASDKRIFGGAARNAGELARVGEIDVPEAERIATSAAQMGELFDVYKNRVGPIADILNDAARRVGEGENATKVKKDAYEKITERLPEVQQGTVATGVREPASAGQSRPVEQAAAPEAPRPEPAKEVEALHEVGFMPGSEQDIGRVLSTGKLQSDTGLIWLRPGESEATFRDNMPAEYAKMVRVQLPADLNLLQAQNRADLMTQLGVQGHTDDPTVARQVAAALRARGYDGFVRADFPEMAILSDTPHRVTAAVAPQAPRAEPVARPEPVAEVAPEQTPRTTLTQSRAFPEMLDLRTISRPTTDVVYRAPQGVSGGRESPTGATFVGYVHYRTEGEKFSNREGGMVGAKVSDWERAQRCATCNQPIVHAYFVKGADGQVRTYGVEHVHEAMGWKRPLTEATARDVLGALKKASEDREYRRGVIEGRASTEKYEVVDKFNRAYRGPGAQENWDNRIFMRHPDGRYVLIAGKSAQTQMDLELAQELGFERVESFTQPEVAPVPTGARPPDEQPVPPRTAPVAQEPLPPRSWRAGANQAYIRFANPVQRDMFDMAARWKAPSKSDAFQLRNDVSGLTGKAADIRDRLIDAGVPESEIGALARRVREDVRGQMRGVGHDEERVVVDNVGIDPAVLAAYKPPYSAPRTRDASKAAPETLPEPAGARPPDEQPVPPRTEPVAQEPVARPEEVAPVEPVLPADAPPIPELPNLLPEPIVPPARPQPPAQPPQGPPTQPPLPLPASPPGRPRKPVDGNAVNKRIDYALGPPAKTIRERVADWMSRFRRAFDEPFLIASRLPDKTLYASMRQVEQATSTYQADYIEKIEPLLDEIDSVPARHKNLNRLLILDIAQNILDAPDVAKALTDAGLETHAPVRTLPAGLGDATDIAAGRAALEAEVGAAEYAELTRLADEFRRTMSGLTVDKLLAEGLIPQDGYQQTTTLYPQYVPLFVMESQADRAARRPQPVASVTGNPLQARSEFGPGKQIRDPLSAYIEQGAHVRRQILANRAAHQAVTTLTDLAAADPGLTPPSEVEKPIPKRTITLYENGEPKFYEVDGDWAREFLALDQRQQSQLAGYARYLQGVKARTAVVWNAAWSFWNVGKDAQDAFLKEGVWPVGFAKAFQEVNSKAPEYIKNIRAGGIPMGMSLSRRPEFLQNARAYHQWLDNNSLPAKSINKILDILKRGEDILGMGEQVGRQRIANEMRKMHPGIPEDELMMAIREGTYDPPHVGWLVKELDNFILFSKATVSATAGMVRSAKRNPMGFLLRTAAFMAIQGLLFAWNSQFESADELPYYARYGLWPIIIGEYTPKPDPRHPGVEPKKKPIYIPIPKGYGVALTTAPLVALQRGLNEELTPWDAIGEMITDMVSRTAPYTAGEDFVFPVVSTYLQVKQNKDWLTGADIVPEDEVLLPAWEQAGPETTLTARWIADALKPLGLSPRVLDFIVRAEFSGMPADIAFFTDTLLREAGYDPKLYGDFLQKEYTTLEQTQRVPFARRFLRVGGAEQARLDYLERNKQVSYWNTELAKTEEGQKLGLSVPPPLMEYVMPDGNVWSLTVEQMTQLLDMQEEMFIEAIDIVDEQPWYTALEGQPAEQKEIMQALHSSLRSAARQLLYAGAPAFTSEQIGAVVYAMEKKREYDSIPQWVDRRSGDPYSQEQVDAIAAATAAVTELRSGTSPAARSDYQAWKIWVRDHPDPTYAAQVRQWERDRVANEEKMEFERAYHSYLRLLSQLNN